MKLWVQTLIQGLFPSLWEDNVLFSWATTLTVLILVVLVLRRVFRTRLAPRVKYALWSVVLVRALLPVQLPIDLPVSGAQLPSLIQILEQPFAEHISDLNAPNTPIYTQTPDLSEEDVVGSALEPLPDDPYHSQYIQQTQDGDTVVTTIPIWTRYQHYVYVWALGVGLLAAVFLVSNLRFVWKLHRSRRPFLVQNGNLPVYIADCIPSPCLFGLFRPAIYLTPGAAALPEEQRQHILAHEQTHYRQKDHIWSALRCLALALHWYNPLVWLAVYLSKRDGELSCDAGAVKMLGEAERIPYGRTLVSLVAQRSLRPGDLLSCSTSMAEGKKSIQERIAQLVKQPETKKTALFAVVALAALAVVFTFGSSQKQQAEMEPYLYSYSDLRTQIQHAQAIHYSPPPTSSVAYTDPITDADLLEKAKELLAVRDLLTPVTETNWEHEVPYAATVTLTTQTEEVSYYICSFEGENYLITPAQVNAEKYTPVAVFDEEAGAVDTALADLAWQQSERNASTWRVEYPEFKNQLTQLFLGVEECVLLNQSEDYDMEEWLTKYTSFYEIVHGVPWWLKDAPAGWYARAMDAGSWYTIVIPDSIVSQVQAICEEQAQYPSLNDITSALNHTDTIRYAAMSAMDGRVGIDDPEVIKQITDLLQKDLLDGPNPGRITIGQELGVLTIPVDEEHNLSFCLQEVEGGCLLSCAWTDSMWSFDSDTLPVLWVLPSGTAYEIYSIYEDWCDNHPQSASAPVLDWTNEQSFDQLAPGDEILGATPVVIPASGADFTYMITYTRTGLTLEFGLRAEDGTEYSQRVVGGDLKGTIPNIPAGSYTPFVRNTGDYTQYPIYQSNSQDYQATGTLVFLLETPPSSASHPAPAQADGTP